MYNNNEGYGCAGRTVAAAVQEVDGDGEDDEEGAREDDGEEEDGDEEEEEEDVQDVCGRNCCYEPLVRVRRGRACRDGFIRKAHAPRPCIIITIRAFYPSKRDGYC